jgi:ABC-type nitrate/sulfonate/bicarbonate transport system substrate-binding protein
VPTGADANTRAQMLLGGQVDAALLTAPSYFRLESRGLRALTTLADHPSVVIYTALTLKRNWVRENADVPERVIKAHAEAVKLFYDDKAAAMAIYKKYDKAASDEEVARLHAAVAQVNAIDRVPLMPKIVAEATVSRLSADVPAAKNLDFQRMMDMSVVRRLIADGTFEKLFGPAVKAEQERKLKDSYA